MDLSTLIEAASKELWMSILIILQARMFSVATIKTCFRTYSDGGVSKKEMAERRENAFSSCATVMTFILGLFQLDEIEKEVENNPKIEKQPLVDFLKEEVISAQTSASEEKSNRLYV